MSATEEVSNRVEQELEPLTWKFWRKRRYIVTFMTFFGFFNVYSLRANLSVAIVAMTENRTIIHDDNSVTYEQYFSWTSTEQGLILSSFFYGYIITMFPGGIIGGKFGGNVIFGIGIFGTALLTLFTPLVAVYGGLYAVIALRVVEGIFEGVTYPCIHAVWSRWAPPLERSRMATIGFAGAYVGTTVTMPICGILAENLSWESLFYVFGAFGCIWFIGWIILVRESPENDKYIKMDELRYIQSALKITDGRPKLKYPWKKICTSTAVYAICISNFCENWGFYLLLTQLPTFLKDALNYELGNAGIFAAFPYLTVGILLSLAGYLGDYFQVKGWLNTTQVRKYFNCLASFSQACFLVIAAVLMHPVGSLVCIVFAIGLGGIAFSGYAVNHLDIAPQYASVLMGISNTFGTIPGIISPTLTGYIVQTKSPEEWKIVFYIASGVYLIGCFAYWCWCSGELQPWAIEIKEINSHKNSTIDNKLDDVENINKT